MSSEATDNGIHDLGWDQYLKIDRLNSHTLMWGRVSMATLKAALDGRIKQSETKPMAFGRALHYKLLEPDLYERNVFVSGPCDAIVASGKREGKVCEAMGVGLVGGHWRCSAHGGNSDEAEPCDTIITPSEAKAIEQAALSLKRHRVVGLIRSPGGVEQTVCSELMGDPFKGRLDKLVPAQSQYPQTIIDIKKIAAPKSPSRGLNWRRRINKAILDYGYHIQAAAYVDMVERETGQPARHLWAFVEDGEPYNVVPVWLGRWRGFGQFEYRDLISRMRECRKTGTWPGYSDRAIELDPPDWYVKQFKHHMELSAA